MKLGFSFLEELVSSKNMELGELASKLDITLQAVRNWGKDNTVPSKRVSQIAEVLNLESVDIDRLLGFEPLHFEYRTKNGEHFLDTDASERMKVRSEMIYERFFDKCVQEITYDLSALRDCIKGAGKDFLKIAECIRNEFTIPDYRPLGSDDMYALQDRVGFRAFYLPFNQIQLNIEEEQDQTAILFCKNKKYTILVDSDRTVDEAHFDKMHEFLHIIFEGVFQQSKELEELIDKVSGDLIYPKKYLIERYFNNDPTKKPIKNKDLLVSKFLKDTRSQRHILSPRGLARAMRDASLATRNSELYKFLYSEFHSDYRENAVTYSSYGGMDFDFSNRDLLLNFYKNVVDRIENEGFFPLFVKLRKDLVSNLIDPSDFADTFRLKHADGILLKAIWSKDS